jgi:hypothetical protein
VTLLARETLIDLDDCWQRAEIWCTATAGMRIHDTTWCRRWPTKRCGPE